MIRRAGCLRCILLVGCGVLGLPPLAAAPAQGDRSPLAGVAALDKRVTYTETKIPLGELVRKVAADTGARLTATADVADEPVAVVIKDVPARELLEQLADLFDYQWRCLGRGDAARCRVEQDPAARKREASLRQAAYAGARKRLRENVARHATMATWPPDQLAAIVEVGRPRENGLMRFSRDQREIYFSAIAGPEWVLRYRAAESVAQPIPRVLAGLLGRLSPPQWAVLRSGRWLIYASRPRAGEWRLPAGTARLLRTAPLPDYPMSPGGAPPPPPEARESYRWPRAIGYRVAVWLDDRWFPSDGALDLWAGAESVHGNGSPKTFSTPPGAQVIVTAGPLDLRSQTPERTTRLRGEWASDPVLGRKGSFPPPPPPGPAIHPLAGRQLHDRLPELARVYGANFISDAYWRKGGTDGVPLSAEPTPLFRQLESLTGFSRRWDRRGSLVRLRSRSWFLERPREIPLRLLRRWRRSGERYGRLPLEQFLELSTGLRDVQLQHMSDLGSAGALEEEGFDLLAAYNARHAFRLYASLSPARRQALRAGGALRLADATPPQRKLFLRAVHEFLRAQPGAMPPPSRWGGVTLTLKIRPFVQRAGSLAPASTPDRPFEQWEFNFQLGSRQLQNVTVSLAPTR